MNNDIILDFPILNYGSGVFLDGVSYEAEATYIDDNLTVKHLLSGKSFLNELIRREKAKFHVSLRYKNSSEREQYTSDSFTVENDKIICTQSIKVNFSYPPEITPNIIILSDETIIVNEKSGLTDFWEIREKFSIPKYSRIAHYLKIKFGNTDIGSLIHVECDKKYQAGTMKVIVSETAGEGENAVVLLCALDVCNELRKIVKVKPTNPKNAMRLAIITQVLCAIYSYMNNLEDKDQEINSGLLMHLESLEEKTGQNWKSDDFNPSLAATTMKPYAIEALNNETD